jgi:hypothetical protein
MRYRFEETGFAIRGTSGDTLPMLRLAHEANAR